MIRFHEPNFKIAKEWNIPIQGFIESKKHEAAPMQTYDNISRGNCKKTFLSVCGPLRASGMYLPMEHKPGGKFYAP